MNFNENQRQAINHKEGPLLILAGAGSGKTTVLTYKIAELIKNGVEPDQILAVAFTNKAVNEMDRRVNDLLRSKEAKVDISTFHNFCMRVIRQEVGMIPYLKEDYKIISTAEQRQIVNDLVKNIQLNNEQDPKLFKPTELLRYFAKLKNEMVGPKTFKNKNFDQWFLDQEKVGKILEEIKEENEDLFGKLFIRYQQELVKRNGVDLEDILVLTAQLFLSKKSVLTKYQEKYLFLLIDEYQDTNQVQYIAMKLLAEKNKNITAVGDDSQGIFGFRGSDFRNILNFTKDYPEALVIPLEKNYRSTKTILKAANQIIENNTEKTEKQLYTENDEGEKIKFFKARLNQDEAERIATEIKKLIKKGYKYQDIAVFYRNNSDSATIERILKKEEIPYKLSKDGGFFDQPEIVDIIHYLQFVLEPENVSSFKRIINIPKRGVGKTSVEKLIEKANGGNLLDVCKNPGEIKGLNKKTLSGLKDFAKLIEELQFEASVASSIPGFIDLLIKKTKYKSSYDDQEKSIQRIKDRNLKKLVSEAEEMEVSTILTIETFLNEIVKKDIDAEIKEDEEWDEVTLTTVHSAKGLEYKIVFVLGMKEGSFPSQYATTKRAIEEERRLCYVAFTRAKEQLYVSYPEFVLEKNAKGEKVEVETTPSRFLTEFDQDLIEEI